MLLFTVEEWPHAPRLEEAEVVDGLIYAVHEGRLDDLMVPELHAGLRVCSRRNGNNDQTPPAIRLPGGQTPRGQIPPRPYVCSTAASLPHTCSIR